MPARVRQQSDEDRIKALTARVGPIFNEVSGNMATHGKNNVTLWKLHQDLSKIREVLPRSVRIMGEKAFQKEIQYMLSMMLVAKKGTIQADRAVKFVAGYVKYINEKAFVPEEGADDEDTFDDEDNNPAYRLTKSLLDWLLGGFEARDKTIRYRVTQTAAQMVAHLGAIDENQYLSLRGSLIGRLDDKESSVRLQAVVALSKLAGTEDENVEFQDSILCRLLQTMSDDPTSEVRRAALANMLINEDTLDSILERTRDTEVSVRKLVYNPVFSSNLVQGDDEKFIGPSHPRALSVAQREVIVRNGLGDRDDTVRKVAASLLGSWVDYAQVGLEAAIPEEASQRIDTNVLLFLTFFDLDSEEGKVAADALKGIFGTRVEIFDNLDFDHKYFLDLTPEKAFLIRVFVDVCKEQDNSARLEAAVPAINQIVVRVNESHNTFTELVPPELLANLPVEELFEREEQYTSNKIILREMLKLAVNLDYSDELGRRLMNTLAYTMIRQNSLPIDLMGPCLALMRVLALSEPDLVRQMVDIIQEFRDAAYGEIEEPVADLADGEVQQPTPRKSLDQMNDEERAKVEETEMRCLSLCISMLEQVDSPIDQNVTLQAILTDLVIPSVTSTNGSDIIKELALKALGLFCLIMKPLAKSTVPVLIETVHNASHRHKLIIIQTLFDILMIYEWTVFDDKERIQITTTFLLDNIKQEQDPAIKALFCKGTAKLILSGMITDVDAVKNLIKAYVSPATLDNQELRQCLAYFLPIYSQSSALNQRRMREMFIHVFLDICQDRKEAEEEEEDDVVSSSQIAEMFLMWTDPSALREAIKSTGDQDIGEQELGVQLDLAEDILRTLFEKDLKVTIEKEDKRVLVHLLNKIQLPDTVDDFKIKSIKLLIDHLRSRRPLRDSVCNTALKKFENAIVKKFEKQLENINEEEIRELAELNDLFAFLDSIIPPDDDEFSDVERGMKGKKRRSESVLTSNETENESFNGTPPPGKGRKRKAKRPRFSKSDGEEDDVATPHGTPPPEKKTRTVPKRAVAGKKKVEPIILPGDEDEDQEATPGPSRRPAKARAQSEEDEEELDRDLSGLLAAPTVASTSSTASTGTFDSIMDDDEDDDDEEADEVQDLLAAE